MQHILLKKGVDKTTLPTDLFLSFKEHLRILHTDEDDTLSLYLSGALESIGTYGDRDLYLTSYEVFYEGMYDYTSPSSLTSWWCGRWDISNVVIKDIDGLDITSEFTIDTERGMFYPHPLDTQITFDAGFATKDDVPAMLLQIIFRLGADYYENREAIRVGEPKVLPTWVNYSLASIWCPRV